MLGGLGVLLWQMNRRNFAADETISDDEMKIKSFLDLNIVAAGISCNALVGNNVPSV